MTDEIICRRCGLRKKVNCFAKNRRICKDCKNKENKEYRLKSIQKDKQNKRNYYVKNRTNTIKRMIDNNKDNPSYNEYQSQWKIRKYHSSEFFKLKNNIQNFTRYHFEKEKRCGLCGSNKRLEFHHWRYRLPVQRRDFSILCYPCHRNVHLAKDSVLILESQNE